MSKTALMIAPMQWAEVKDIDEVEPLNESDSDCLVEIREVLKKHGKRDRLGVALLHSHFEMAVDEVLVEFSDSESRVLTLKPVKQAEAGNTMGTIWKLLDGDFKSMAHCHQYCKRDWLTKGHNRDHTVKGR